MLHRTTAILRGVLACLVALGVLATACARLEGPDVYPPAVETPVVETQEPEATPTKGPINESGGGVSTRTPLTTPSPSPTPSKTFSGLWDPEAEAAQAAYAAPGYGYGTSTTSEPTRRAAAGTGSIEYAAPEAANALGSLPDIQPVRMKGVWVATVLGIDFPSVVGDVEAQKRELLEILENARRWELDTVFFQARPMGDAFYDSSLNPWSHFLTGTQGTDPGWDPLAFMVEEAHRRGLALHAWLNPYRAAHSEVNMTLEDLDPESFAAKHPEWVISYEGGLYLDPAIPQVREHIAETVREIIEKYDVDGIHFDDYFYPYDYPLPPGAERDGILDRERRDNVTSMLRLVHDTIKGYNDRIIFGVSPFGIWKNSSTDPEGSDTAGMESYYQSADTLTWVREKLVDYIAPQLYWPIGYEIADYRRLVDWWSSKLSGSGVSLIIGQGVHRDEIAGEIVTELRLNALHPEITGSIFFSYRNLLEDPQCAQAIRNYYSE